MSAIAQLRRVGDHSIWVVSYLKKEKEKRKDCLTHHTYVLGESDQKAKVVNPPPHTLFNLKV